MAIEIIEREVYYSVKINFHHNWESKIVNLPGLNANLSEFFFFFCPKLVLQKDFYQASGNSER